LNGSLLLRAGVREGRTVLLESRGTYPLQVLRPHIEPAGGGLSLVLLLLSGGLLDGDRVSVEVVVERGARLALRTQAATQVHGGRSEQRLDAMVGEDGWFSYVPHAIVPHGMADYQAHTRVTLAAGARVLVADALSPGRVQFGERFAYRQVRLALDITQGAALLARERSSIRPDAALRCAQWGSFSHMAGAYLVGTHHAPVVPLREGVQVGVTELARGGWFVRALADRATAIDDVLAELSVQWWADLCTVNNPARGSLVSGDVSVSAEDPFCPQTRHGAASG
jgi:urease accessory protein